MTKNMLIGQSGGPTAAINSSLAGAVAEALKQQNIGEIYGAHNGIKGVLKHDFVNLRNVLKTESDIELLKETPAMALGSCRFKLPDYPSEIYNEILKIFKEYNIGFFFYIGGNDSMDTVKKLSEYFNSIGEDIKVVGIPKTIDNDLCLTDHTPGFGSAAKFIAASTMEIAADSSVYDCTSVTIIEIMGRNTGWLTAASSLARLNGTKAPHMIYLPERAFDSKKFLLDLNELIKNERHVVVAVSEGLKLANGNYVADSEQTGLKDAFGHKYLSGIGKYLENLVMSNIGCKVRSVCLNVSQRCASHISSATDINEAFNVGSAAVDFALSGKTGVVAIIERLSNRPYSVSYEFCDVDEIANNVKFVPDNYITENGYDITDEMTEYLKPLIIGEQTKHIRNGLPVFMRINFSNHELHDKDVVILNQTLA